MPRKIPEVMNMIKRTITILAAAAFMLLSLAAHSAEAPKVRFVTAIYGDTKGEGMAVPEGVACGDSSVVIVSDTGKSRLLKFTYHDGILQGGEEMPVQGLSNPGCLQMDAKGEIYVLDGKQRRIMRISADGSSMAPVVPQGVPEPADFVPRSFKVGADGTLYVLDIFSARVLALDPAGKYIRSLPFPDDYVFISDLAVDAQGTIYLIDSAKSVVYSAGKDAGAFTALTKSLKENIFFAANMIIDSRGTIYLADQNNSAIITLNRDGSFQARHLSMGWREGLLHYPTQMCINSNGDFFIADRDNNRIDIFSIIQ